MDNFDIDMEDFEGPLDALVRSCHRWEQSAIKYCQADDTLPVTTACLSYAEFYFIVDGAMVFHVGDERATLDAGSVGFTNAHFGNHSFLRPTCRYHALSLDIRDRDDLAFLAKKPFLIARRPADMEKLDAAFRALNFLYRARRGTLPEIKLKNLLVSLLLETLEQASSRPHARGESGGVTQAVLELIHRNLSNPDFRAEDRAGEFHLGKDHFCRLFKSEIHRTPARYLREIRIARARMLLVKTGMSVKEIAYAVGFNDPLYFSRVFLAETGVCPSVFRSAEDRVGQAADPRPRGGVPGLA